MEVTRKIKPGANGSKRYLRHYGDRLVCVRYRNDHANHRNLVTVELIVAEHPQRTGNYKEFDTLYPHPRRHTLVRIGYQEKQLQRAVRQRGAKWLKSKKLWQLPFYVVQEMGLEARIVNQDEAAGEGS